MVFVRQRKNQVILFPKPFEPVCQLWVPVSPVCELADQQGEWLGVAGDP